MKKICTKVSVKSKIINFLFKFTHIKRNYSTEKNVQEYLENYQSKKIKYDIPIKNGMQKQKMFDTEVYSYNGDLQKNTGRILLYIHGGSFAEEAIKYQIKFAINIAKKTNSTLLMPRYKLIPEGSYKDMYQFIDSLYEQVLNNCNEVNFLGDSSGGGFILSYSMYLRDNKKKQPKNILMLSPWVDLSMENEELKKSEKLDNISSIAGNKYCGKKWAADLDVKNCLISPIYGKFSNLPIITIATGEYDILKPDCLRLSKLLSDASVEHNYIEYKGQAHDFGCYPTKEGKNLIKDFSDIINDI